MNLAKTKLIQLYQGMLNAYGHQDWWPAETPFEVAIGAVLTQNTAWTNVEKAINNLKAVDVVSLEAVLALPMDELAQLIRPSGYYNMKAQRLRALCEFIVERGGLEALAVQSLPELRSDVLAVKGVGPETADDILLYALDKPVFVIDTYTRRLLSRNDGRRYQRAGCHRHPQGIFVISSKRPIVMARRTSSSSHWTLLPSSRHWCRSRE